MHRIIASSDAIFPINFQEIASYNKHHYHSSLAQEDACRDLRLQVGCLLLRQRYVVYHKLNTPPSPRKRVKDMANAQNTLTLAL